MNDVGGCHGDGMIDEGVGSACKMAKVESLQVNHRMEDHFQNIPVCISILLIS